MFRITHRRGPTGLAPAVSMAPATSRVGERPTAARVVRRRQISGVRAAARRLLDRDPFHVHAPRFLPPRLARSA